MRINNIKEFDYREKGATQAGYPTHPLTPRQITNENRIKKAYLPSNIFWIKMQSSNNRPSRGYPGLPNLISMEEHAEKLRQKLGVQVEMWMMYAARRQGKGSEPKEGGCLLGNLRYLTEVSTFENAVNLVQRMAHTTWFETWHLV